MQFFFANKRKILLSFFLNEILNYYNGEMVRGQALVSW